MKVLAAEAAAGALWSRGAGQSGHPRARAPALPQLRLGPRRAHQHLRLRAAQRAAAAGQGGRGREAAGRHRVRAHRVRPAQVRGHGGIVNRGV